MLYLLDTDHVSLLQRNHPLVVLKLSTIPLQNRAVTVVTVSEQVQGRLAVVSQARSEQDAARGFGRLQETISFFRAITVVPYDVEATKIFERLRKQGVRIGTQDLRIAAIALSRDAVLVTRNGRDFKQIPNLQLADWSYNA